MCHIALDNGTELRSSWTTDQEKTYEELRDESVIDARTPWKADNWKSYALQDGIKT